MFSVRKLFVSYDTTGELIWRGNGPAPVMVDCWARRIPAPLRCARLPRVESFPVSRGAFFLPSPAEAIKRPVPQIWGDLESASPTLCLALWAERQA